jgi:hypothetical protein
MGWCAGGAEGIVEVLEEGDGAVEVVDVGKEGDVVEGRMVKWWEWYCAGEGEEELLAVRKGNPLH